MKGILQKLLAKSEFNLLTIDFTQNDSGKTSNLNEIAISI